KGKFELAEMLIEEDCLLTQAPLHVIMSSHGFRALICTVRRGSETFIPNATSRSEKGTWSVYPPSQRSWKRL
ncbi:MAG: hypothetical protein II113_00650, partial [Firmicutes bacterium]|nr:hypothetical protein [Bacillota bacterium]